jgi:hypothetical protein
MRRSTMNVIVTVRASQAQKIPNGQIPFFTSISKVVMHRFSVFRPFFTGFASGSVLPKTVSCDRDSETRQTY